MRSRLVRIIAATLLLISLPGLVEIEPVEASSPTAVSESQIVLPDSVSQAAFDGHCGSHPCHFGHCPAIVVSEAPTPLESIRGTATLSPLFLTSISPLCLFRPPLST